jgi:type IV secretion system protein VirD4
MLPIGYTVSSKFQQQVIGFNQPGNNPPENELITNNGEAHLLTIAPTGAGKGRGNIIPACLSYREGSMLILDPKGEAARVTAKARRQFGKVAIIDPFKIVTNNPDRFNPFDIAIHHGTLPEQQGVMIANALQQERGSFTNDPFWDNKAHELITGLTITELLGNKSFTNLRKYLFEKDVDYKLASMLDSKAVSNTFAYELIGSYLQSPAEKTRPSILATAQQHLAILGDPAVLESLSGPSSFNINDLLNGEAITIYLVIPPNKLRGYSALLRLWITSFLYLFAERKSRPATPTLFIIDECASLGRLEPLVSAICLLRSYGIRIWTMFQDLGQIKQLYPQDWTTIINNCDVIQTFGIRTHLMAKDLADVLGVFTPAQLLALPADTAVLGRAGKASAIIKRLDYLKDKIFQDSGYEVNAFYEKGELEK